MRERGITNDSIFLLMMIAPMSAAYHSQGEYFTPILNPANKRDRCCLLC